MTIFSSSFCIFPSPTAILPFVFPLLSLERITLERLPRTKDQTLGLLVEKKKRFLGSRPTVRIKIIEREQIPSGCRYDSSLLRISISFLSSAKSADTTRFHYKRSLQDFLFDFPSIFATRWKICDYKSSKSKIVSKLIIRSMPISTHSRVILQKCFNGKPRAPVIKTTT